AETPLRTDSQGQSAAVLTTSTAATVTARSGGTSGMTQVTTASCNLSTITLDVTPQDVIRCTDSLTLTAKVDDNNGDPRENIQVVFSETTKRLGGTFAPSSPSTDPMGMATVTLTPNQTPCSNCQSASNPDPNRPVCTPLSFLASDRTGTFP